MPALKSTDPLVALPARVKRSTRDELRREAEFAGITLSDLIRARLNHPGETVRGAPRATKRMAKVLAPPSGDDPYLMREKARVVNNLNQLARAANAGHLSGSLIKSVEVLSALSRIEIKIDELLSVKKATPSAH